MPLNYHPENRIPKILADTSCEKHNAPKGAPCFPVFPASSDEGLFKGICGARAKRAGYIKQLVNSKPGAKIPGKKR